MIITVDDDCIILKNKELERERERERERKKERVRKRERDEKEIDWNELETDFLSQVSQIPEQFESSAFFQSHRNQERERERERGIKKPQEIS